MISPKSLAENSDKSPRRGRQAAKTENSVGLRIIEALGTKSRSQLARETGLPESTIGDAIKRGIANADRAVQIASALGVSVDWLLTGGGNARAELAEVSELDWVQVPRW